MDKLTTTQIGRFGESAAAKYLKKHGYRILARNYKASHNEIDIIAEDKENLVFIEVKTRTENSYQTPIEAVMPAKQKRTIAAARAYLYKSGSDKRIRFDIIEVYLERAPRLFSGPVIKSIEHIVDAFDASRRSYGSSSF